MRPSIAVEESVIQLGLSPLLSGLAAAQEDSAGLMLEERNLPQRVRSKKKSAGQ